MSSSKPLARILQFLQPVCEMTGVDRKWHTIIHTVVSLKRSYLYMCAGVQWP